MDASDPSAQITADYTYYVVGNIKITPSSVLGRYPVDLTGGKTIVAYLDPNIVQTNVTDYTLTKFGSADADKLLEAGETFELSVDGSTCGLTDYGDFTLQIKPATAAVATIGSSS